MPEITKSDADEPRPIPAFIWLLLAAAAVFVYLFGLDIPFVGPDESRYAQVAREMLERGDWITPTLGGHPWFEKPALLYWLEIGSYKLFGINEFAARFGSALCGLGTVASLWLLSRFAGKRQFANWLALIAATTLGILVFSRGASFDIVITLPLTAALVSFFVYDRMAVSERNNYAALVLFYLFIGIAILAKGLIGIVFPFAIVTLFYLLSRRIPRIVFLISPLWGIPLAAGIASTWYWPMYERHGYQFINEFFVQHHFQRFTSNKYQHPQPFYFFLWVLPLMTLPWLPFFFAAVWKMAKAAFRRGDGESSDPLQVFALAWLIVPLAFFSFSGSKLPGYILPAVPAAIVITALYLYTRVNGPRWRNGALVTAIATFALAIVLITTAVPQFAETDSVRSLIRTADESGYAASKVLMLHTISHNAEFYAAGRLQRDANGKQVRISSVSEVADEARRADGKVLVMVPIEYLAQLTASPTLTTEVLNDNGELAIAAVSLR